MGQFPQALWEVRAHTGMPGYPFLPVGLGARGCEAGLGNRRGDSWHLLFFLQPFRDTAVVSVLNLGSRCPGPGDLVEGKRRLSGRGLYGCSLSLWQCRVLRGLSLLISQVAYFTCMAGRRLGRGPKVTLYRGLMFLLGPALTVCVFCLEPELSRRVI